MIDALRPIDALYRSAARLSAMRPAMLGETELSAESIEGLYHVITDAEAEIREAIAAIENDDGSNGDPDDGESLPKPFAAPMLRLVHPKTA